MLQSQKKTKQSNKIQLKHLRAFSFSFGVCLKIHGPVSPPWLIIVNQIVLFFNKSSFWNIILKLISTHNAAYFNMEISNG